MSDLFPNYARLPLEFQKGSGTKIFDKENVEYLDLTSGIGVTNLGYNHPELVKVLHDQVEKIWHIPNLYESELQEKVAKLLAIEQDYLAFFCNSGAEANEAAIKLARKATGKEKIFSFKQSFHGRTFGAMSATGQAKIHQGFAPLLPTFDYLTYNSFDDLLKIDESVAAVMVEVIQGEGGVLPAEKEWLQMLAKVAKDNGALLIIDEVQTGIGRTGTFYAWCDYGISPDIFTLAKGLGNGVPVGAMLGKKELGEVFSQGSHGTTFGGNRLALSVAEKVIELVNQEEFLTEVQEKSTLAFDVLQKGLAKNKHVKAIRGKGLMIGIALDSSDTLQKALQKLRERHVLALSAGNDVLRLLPPLTIANEELQSGLAAIIQVLEEIENE
ncbi:acetylornithine aminotransferase [Pilibacter termitis]|uniref:Acetylornithine aminotransferase n=1 Tax=Pilibacter termitis TaxID=263852 RepID=A0A1T4MRK6_9ENTE|nr:acetylornithine transaminase [Pilibacter termitis]SJZ69466.1 acetylornithine aminotransferase [Pilibacter termitis]